MNTIKPSSIKIIRGLPPIVDKSSRVAIDTEFFGMNKKKMHRPTGTFASLACTIDGKTVYIITNKDEIAEFLENISAGVWIFHNAKFDIFHLRRFCKVPQRKRLWDTMLVEKVMYSGYYDDFALDDLVRRRLDLFLLKESREEFEGAITMSKALIEYAAIDVVATWMAYQSQRKEISDTDIDIWKNIELPYLWCILGMSGITLDLESWKKLSDYNGAKAKEYQEKYPDMNLNSHQQVKKRIIELGEDVENTKEETLLPLVDTVPFVKDLLEYRSIAKRKSTYGEKFVTKFVETDGKIHADFWPHGTKNARSSCKNPNLQNQPNEDAYRRCYVAEKDNVLVIADYSAQEPRIAAFLSNDDGLIKAFGSGEKIYTVIARDALGLKITKKDPEYKNTKSLILGIFYGMSPYGLAWRMGIDKDEAESRIRKIFDTYPGVSDYVERLQNTKEDYTTSVTGRKIWLNKYQPKWEREVLNYPISTTAAEMKKIAAYRVMVQWCGDDFYTNTPFVLDVHDELVFEVHNSGGETMKTMLNNALKDVAEELHPGVPGEVEIGIGKTWADKK